MFNLEQSIAEWRQQMLAAGIKTPVPLEELESHLREEIERQTKLGMDARLAFETTVHQIGQANQLKAEFAKEQDTHWFWAFFWLALCSWVFFELYQIVAFYLVDRDSVQAPFFIFITTYVAIYVTVLFGSVRYFRTAKTGCDFIETLERELFNKLKPEHLFLGWFAAGFTLYRSVHHLYYFEFFSYHPVAEVRVSHIPPVSAWEYSVVTFNMLEHFLFR